MKRASKPPAYCAACFQQKPEKRHVDFESAWDGPSIPMPEVGPGILMTIDDLVICEDCIAIAAKMVGMVHDEELKQENQELGEALEEAGKEISGARETIKGLREANDQLMDERFAPRKDIRRKVFG